MLLTISTTYQPATDLGYLLHKKPTQAQRFDLPFGVAHIFYREATPERCTAVLLLDIDPIGLIRDRRGSGSFALAAETMAGEFDAARDTGEQCQRDRAG